MNLVATGASTNMRFLINGSEAARIDSSGNVGIGTTSPSEKLHVAGALRVTGAQTTAGTGVYLDYSSGIGSVNVYGPDTSTQGIWRVYTATSNGGTGSEKARIDSSGNLLVGTTSKFDIGRVCSLAADGVASFETKPNSNISYNAVVFKNSSNTTIGRVLCSTTGTSYETTSDYRLKNSVSPMTGALAKIALLKPCTYKWNADGSNGQGFIAHELAEVVPECVTGEKDAVNADGSIQPQGIDTSFLVATLTAAIKEQQAIIESMKTEIDALKAKVGA